jgi:hypothetical protein
VLTFSQELFQGFLLSKVMTKQLTHAVGDGLKRRRHYSGPLCVLVVTLHTMLMPAMAGAATDGALWSGALFRFPGQHGLDYSVEYQVRLDEDARSLSSHFAEFLGYRRLTEDLLLNGGYRFTIRPDHEEHRLYFGGFWDVTPDKWRPSEDDPNRLKMVLQVGYEHDFNVEFDDRLMGSNSIRYILVAAKPVNRKVAPFLMAGVLTTWNSAYDFGIDKIRVGGGLALRISQESLIKVQYMLEEARFMVPTKRTNIIWVRYEMLRW